MELNIAADGLTELYDGGIDSVVDIVFVHGLRGNPRTTWEAVYKEDDEEFKVYWPAELLPKTIKESRIFSFGYLTEFATFYPILPEPVSHTKIDHHSTSLILKLGNYRRVSKTSNRPIIFVAHSLGGLVVANALAGKYETDAQGKGVVDHTYGALFLGTPFKGSAKAPWATMARQVFAWMGGDTNDQTINDLDKRSKKLQSISVDFHMLLQSRLASKELKPIQIACFFEEIATIKKKKNVGLIVTADSATLVGYPQIGINANHTAMCRYVSADTTAYQLVTGKIKEMIDNFSKSTDEVMKNGTTVANVTMGNNNLNLGGYLTGVIMGTTENAVNLNLNNNVRIIS
ncbi:hypothetical protein BKA66DRAFT_475497 [Pyrenochaeta sp. MPI-SDFR-AT-0127]|nr:hypothetical protein BKA66DRAFT_475497 [Pyrenochaeta sp. MPI-SDFR-AT-0127]